MTNAIMKKMKGQKGFTLVEVIVVLVILAILAAIAVPALTGYIDKANDKAVVSQTRTAVVALQTLVSDAYGNGVSDPDTALEDITVKDIKDLSGDASIVDVGDVDFNGTAVSYLEVEVSSGKIGVFDNGSYSVADSAEEIDTSIDDITAGA